MRHLFLLTFLLVSMCFGTVSAQSALPEVNLVSPADGDFSSIVYDLTFVWSTSAPVDPDVTFDIHFYSESPSQGLLDTIVSGLSDTTYTFEFDDAGQYSWFVVARNQSGDSTVSDTASFLMSCCGGSTGDVNASGDPATLTDLTLLVNHLFVTFEPLACRAEANTDGDPDCNINLTDVTRLTRAMFGIALQWTEQCYTFDNTLCD